MAHSVRCRSNLRTRWNGVSCIACAETVDPGTEVTPNCGWDDDGHQHEPPRRRCKAKTFNDGTGFFCRTCSQCPPGRTVTRACSTVADTLCAQPISAPPTNHIMTPQGSTFPPPVSKSHLPVVWAVSALVLVSFTLAAVAVHMRRRRGRRTKGGGIRRPSYVNPSFRNSDVENSLNHSILSAPLQTVLDNLDVLEELVILLDPETLGIKNTKHLASMCNFTSAWITYSYSMKESKSPLRAVLEAVATRSPDWTVGHLVGMLRRMERNDAIAALAKLRVHDAKVPMDTSHL